MATVGHGGDIVGLQTTDWDVQNAVEQLIRDAQAKFEEFTSGPVGEEVTGGDASLLDENF
jgi:hypothetical protein